MKILSFNAQIAPYNQIKSSKKDAVQQKVVDASSFTDSKSHLNEILGRTQVAFKGDLKNLGNKVIYSQKGLVTTSEERIEYNKKTHSFEFESRYANGNLKKYYSFNPETGLQIEKDFNKDGSGRSSEKSPKKTSFFTYAAGGVLASEERILPNGDRTNFQYDNPNNRIIAKSYAFNSPNPTVMVYDLLTTNPISQNDKRAIYTEQIPIADDIYEDRTYNLLTNYIYESKTYKSGRLVSGYKYDDYNNVIWNAVTTQDGLLVENDYNLYGTPVKTVTKNFAQKTTEIETFDDFGNLTSDTLFEYDKFGKLTKKTQYNINTNLPFKITTFSRNEAVEDEFDSYGNLSKKAVFKNNKLISETKFYSNGKVSKVHDSYIGGTHKSGFKYTRTRTEFDRYGRQLRCEFYQDEHPLRIDFYNEKDGYIEKVRNFNHGGCAYCDTVFDNHGIMSEQFQYNSFDILIKKTRFYYGSNSPSMDVFYNPDGSWKKVAYTMDRRVQKVERHSLNDELVEIEEYYPDGTTILEKRIYDNVKGTVEFFKYTEDGRVFQHNFSYRQKQETKNNKNASNNTQKQKTTQHTIHDTVKKIGKYASRTNFDPNMIPLEQWKELAEFLKMEDVNELIKMQKTTHRKLAQMTHPDHAPEGKETLYEDIFKIVTTLWDYSKKNGGDN